MIVIKTITEIGNYLGKQKTAIKQNPIKVALIPTMGALHDGHLSLIKAAQDFADIIVVSIFVNKTQFNDLNDYQKYPKQYDSDLEKLKSCKVDVVFLPEDVEIFNELPSFKIVPTQLADCLCGATRPGHFEGVALIVTKLFNIIKPDFAIFGEKDFQQLQIIKTLVSDLNFSVKIVAQKTARQTDGLALSSRNQRLNDTGKVQAALLYKTLNKIAQAVKESSLNLTEISALLAQQKKDLLQLGFEKIDYLEIRDEQNLQLLDNTNTHKPMRIFIAAYLQTVRLIDNIPVTLLQSFNN